VNQMVGEPRELRFFGVTGRLVLPATGLYRLYVNGFANIRESVPHKYEWQGVDGEEFIYREVIDNSDFDGIKSIVYGFEDEEEGLPWEPEDEANTAFMIKNCVAYKLGNDLHHIIWESIFFEELHF